MTEVKDFRTRLGTAMRERLREVEALGMLDAPALASLKKQHDLTLFTESRRPERPSWGNVLVAIQTLEAGSGIMGSTTGQRGVVLNGNFERTWLASRKPVRVR